MKLIEYEFENHIVISRHPIISPETKLNPKQRPPGMFGFIVTGDAHVLPAIVKQGRYGVNVTGPGNVYIEKLQFKAASHAENPVVHAAGVNLKDFTGKLLMRDCIIDMNDAPLTHYPGGYATRNTECIGSNAQTTAAVKIQNCMLIDPADAVIDAKCDYEIDESSLMNGHRTVRAWNESVVVLNHCEILTHKDGVAFWTEGPAKIVLNDCRLDGQRVSGYYQNNKFTPRALTYQDAIYINGRLTFGVILLDKTKENKIQRYINGTLTEEKTVGRKPKTTPPPAPPPPAPPPADSQEFAAAVDYLAAEIKRNAEIGEHLAQIMRALKK